jgi:phosphoribosylamine--glycine ligase
VNIIPYGEFVSFDDAVDHVTQNPGRYVIKPSGEAQNVKQRLFVGEEDDGQDIILMLEAYKKALSDEIKVFQLQRRVSGVEVAEGGFFNGKTFIYPINVNFEHKKLCPGDIGPSTGEMGTSMFWTGPNQLFNQTLLKMEPVLASEGYVGYIDVNCIVNNHGIYPLEFTSRFGYPTISIQQAGMLTPIGQFFLDLADGNDPKLKTRSGFQIGVRIVVPPFPFDDDETFDSFSKDSVIVFKKPPQDEIHIEDVKQVRPMASCGNLRSNPDRHRHGADHAAGAIAGLSRIKNVLIPNMYYRTDIGDRWVEDTDRLHTWGYLR